MPLSKPNNPPFVTTSVVTPTYSSGMLDSNENATRVNQLHGIASNNALGAGIPKQVMNVQVSIANAQTGSTCTVSVLYRIDPTDSSFAGVKIWVKGYQGNSQLVQVASGTSSPAKFVLNNTGETVSFTIQAYGNGGSAPLTQSPTSSGTLPKSTTGGFGSSTVTYFNVSNPPPGPVFSTNAPQKGDMWRYNEYGDKQWDLCSAIPTVGGAYATGPASNLVAFGSADQAASSAGTAGASTVTASDPLCNSFTSAATASTVPVAGVSTGSGTGRLRYSLGVIRRFSARVQFGQTTNCRFWIGLVDTLSPFGAGMANDNPPQNMVAFRYSAGVDTKWQCVTQTGLAAQTLVNSNVAVDTAATHLFEFAYDGTNVNFYIDAGLVAQISTTIPTTATGLCLICNADNKNTPNVVSLATFVYMGVTLKL